MTTTARRRRRGFTNCGEDKKKEERIMEKFFTGGLCRRGSCGENRQCHSEGLRKHCEPEHGRREGKKADD